MHNIGQTIMRSRYCAGNI